MLPLKKNLLDLNIQRNNKKTITSLISSYVTTSKNLLDLTISGNKKINK